MQVPLRKMLGGLIGLMLLTALAGCSGKAKKFKVSGTLSQGGNPLKSPMASGGPPVAGAAGSGIFMSFFTAPEGARPASPSEAGLEPIYAIVQPDGQFEVPGGLKAGKYIVAVHVFTQGPQFPESDALKNQFSFAKSKIEVEINADRTDLQIELDKYR